MFSRARVVALVAAAAFGAAIWAGEATAAKRPPFCGRWQSPTQELACGKAAARRARRSLVRVDRSALDARTLASVSGARSVISRAGDVIWGLHKAYAVELDAEGRLLELPWTTDWQTAVQIVQRAWPGSAAWLLACSSSEGGWGAWIPNTTGSGAGGWMQYMEGTFVHDYDAAIAQAHVSHLPYPPAQADTWYSALGQAFAGGWAYFYDRPVGKWTGSRC